MAAFRIPDVAVPSRAVPACRLAHYVNVGGSVRGRRSACVISAVGRIAIGNANLDMCWSQGLVSQFFKELKGAKTEKPEWLRN